MSRKHNRISVRVRGFYAEHAAVLAFRSKGLRCYLAESPWDLCDMVVWDGRRYRPVQVKLRRAYNGYYKLSSVQWLRYRDHAQRFGGMTLAVIDDDDWTLRTIDVMSSAVHISGDDAFVPRTLMREVYVFAETEWLAAAAAA